MRFIKLFLVGVCLLWMFPDIVQSQDRIAILGCHRQYRPAPALVRYVDAKPDLAIWVGDNVYADSEDDPQVIIDSYAALEAKPAFRQLRQETPFLVTWDDHDFGLNNAGAEYPLKEESKAIFRSFWQLEDQIPEAQDGIYYAAMYGEGNRRLQVILLDVRYNRALPHSGGDILGEAQWGWLEEQLKQPAALRFIVSGSQILLESETSSSETWDQYPESQQRLFDTIKKTRAEGVVFITGDQHYAEVVRRDGVLDYDAVELQFASVNQIEDPEFNPYRVSPVAQSLHSYALIDVQWEADDEDVPHISYKVYDAQTNQVEITYRVNFSELKREIQFTERTSFVGSHQVTLSHVFSGLDMRYTTDGSVPDSSSKVYEEPIMITESSVITAALFDKDGQRRSAYKKQAFTKMDVATSTSRTGALVKGLQYIYTEGTFLQLPDFEEVEITKRGKATDFDVSSLANREDHYAIQYSGYIDVPATGLYTFYTYSDDGSKLWIDGKLVVDNDGSHSARLRSGLIGLEKGLHRIQVDYFEDYDGQVLQVRMKVPGSNRMELVTFEQLWMEEGN